MILQNQMQLRLSSVLEQMEMVWVSMKADFLFPGYKVKDLDFLQLPGV